MNKTTRPTAIYFRTTKKGQPRAYRASWQQLRSFPIGWQAAHDLIRTGEAIWINGPSEGVSIFCGSFWKETTR